MSVAEEEIVENQPNEDTFHQHYPDPVDIVMNALENNDFEPDQTQNYDQTEEEEILIMKQTQSELNSPHIIQNELNTSKNSIYSHLSSKREKNVIKIGSLTLSRAEAKARGLIDANGQLKLKQKDIDVSKSMNKKLELTNRLVQEREQSDIQPEEYSFQPKKDEAARKAMMNSRCGYDFVSRLEDREGTFFERAEAEINMKKMSKAEWTHLSEEYDAKLNKLACPKCKKVQSFDEYYEKRRKCAVCKERFTQLNVFSTKLIDRCFEFEKKRLEKIQEKDKEVYPYLYQPPKHRPPNFDERQWKLEAERQEKLKKIEDDIFLQNTNQFKPLIGLKPPPPSSLTTQFVSHMRGVRLPPHPPLEPAPPTEEELQEKARKGGLMGLVQLQEALDPAEVKAKKRAELEDKLKRISQPSPSRMGSEKELLPFCVRSSQSHVNRNSPSYMDAEKRKQKDLSLIEQLTKLQEIHNQKTDEENMTKQIAEEKQREKEILKKNASSFAKGSRPSSAPRWT